ncbi:hypothetical protein [Sedimentitalea sp. HM32M-2]|uniref:hypothetical protein n=1 Tax=Sedimentitalea sp. HM32M-2 TaxID=3351566 RepID=UPI0036D3E900
MTDLGNSTDPGATPPAAPRRDRGGISPWVGRVLLVLSLVWMPADTVRAADVTLSERDLRRLGSGPLIAPDIAGLPADPALPVVDPRLTALAARQLQGLVSRGISAGFGGLLYENRDRSHSILSRDMFPNLTFLTYDQDLIDAGLDYGLAGRILFPALVFGNSSTALTWGRQPRSQARLAMTMNGGAAAAYRDYRANSIYIYPEHHDHDATDLFPANWPYTIISQGSSHSDMPFLQAVAMTLAAFPADTRTALEAAGLVAPTVQMILRRNLTLVSSRAQYLSALAHPTVFQAEWLRPGRMIGQAAALRPEDIPPVVRLRVLQEDFQTRAGLAQRDEHLFTTPSAIARIWRGYDWQRQMLISAEATEDPNGRDLRFDWVLLRGDPERVQIEPIGARGARARITLRWHDPFVLPRRGPTDETVRDSSRVDIGVFVWNGRSDSAPAIVSVSFPTHQHRQYRAGRDGRMRLELIDYDALGRGVAYDPVLHWSADWSDRFSWSDDGALLGWTRLHQGRRLNFDASGLLADGTPMVHELAPLGDAPPELQFRRAEAAGQGG